MFVYSVVWWNILQFINYSYMDEFVHIAFCPKGLRFTLLQNSHLTMGSSVDMILYHFHLNGRGSLMMNTCVGSIDLSISRVTTTGWKSAMFGFRVGFWRSDWFWQFFHINNRKIKLRIKNVSNILNSHHYAIPTHRKQL
jgi:hypothetical protein